MYFLPNHFIVDFNSSFNQKRIFWHFTDILIEDNQSYTLKLKQHTFPPRFTVNFGTQVFSILFLRVCLDF